MNKRKGLIAFIAVVVALAGLLAGCATSPAPQPESGASAVELAAAQELANAAREQVTALESKLEASEAQAASLKGQLTELAAESELVGATPSDTAANIIRVYNETHSYTIWDLFVCADMSMDVWNMLQAQGINAVIQIGSVDADITNMEDSDHAWVLAEVSPGTFLALETTNGQVVQREDNPRYYGGWSFDNPREYKRFEELKYEHNLRVSLYNELREESQKVYAEYESEFSYLQELMDEFNNKYSEQPYTAEAQALNEEISDQLAIVKKLEGSYGQLETLKEEQGQELDNIVPQMKALTG